MDDEGLEPIELSERRDWEGRAVAAQAYAEHEHQRASNATERLTERNLLFAQAEHRVKNAMAIVSGMAETLETQWYDLTTAERLAALGAIRRGADQAVSQAEALLEDARVELQPVGTGAALVDLTEALAINVRDFNHVSSQHEVRLIAPAAVHAFVDPASLQQVVGHLLENAVKYSPDGGAVTVTAERNGPNAIITVADQGIGVPKDADIFAPFVRGKEAASDIRGSGLGLYLVRSLVTHMGGAVDCWRNESGVGSTFMIRLPAARMALTDADEVGS